MLFRQANKQWIISADLTLPLVWLTFSQGILPFKLLSHSVILLRVLCLFRRTFHDSDVCITVLANLFCHISVQFIGNSLTGYRQRSECFIVPCNTRFSSSKQHTQSVYRYTPFHVLPKHTLVCSQALFYLFLGLVLNLTLFQVCSAE